MIFGDSNTWGWNPANDLKVRYTVSPQDGDNIEKGVFGVMFEGNVEKSKKMPPYFEGVAKTYGVEYFDAGKYVKSSDEDGLHLQADQHKILGEEIAKVVKQMME